MTRRKRVYGRPNYNVPVQIYVSESDRAALQALSERRGEPVAVIFRRWIKRATREKRTAAPAAPADPRQLPVQFFPEEPSDQAREDVGL